MPDEQSDVLTVRTKLFPQQKQFARSKALYRALVAGVGSGKSFVGAYDLLLRSQRNKTYMVIAPTYPILNQSTLRSFLDAARMLNLLDPNALKLSPPPQVTTLNGATVLFRSSENPEHLRGPNLSGVWLDEASLMKPEVFNIAIGRLREAGQLGWLSATFTPKGMAHWTYETFGTGRVDTELFRARTRDNPFNSPEFAKTLARHYTGDFAAQELEGEFVDEENSCQVIPSAWVRLAQARWTADPPAMPLDMLGVDVSRGGADATCIAPRHGKWFGPIKRYRGEATDDGKKAAELVYREHKDEAVINVDAIGLGASCYDFLKDMPGMEGKVRAVNVASGTQMRDNTGRYRFANVRAAMHWTLREALDPDNGDELALPPSNELFADLCSARYELRAQGIAIEKKDKIKERLGRSPDLADAVCLAHWEDGVQARIHVLDMDAAEKQDQEERKAGSSSPLPDLDSSQLPYGGRSQEEVEAELKRLMAQPPTFGVGDDRSEDGWSGWR